MKPKYIFYLLLLLCATNGMAQKNNFKFDFDSYNWESEPATYTPAATEKDLASIELKQNYFLEFRQVSYEGKTAIEKVTLTHSIIYINDDKAIEENNKFYFPMHNGANIDRLKVRVIKDGKVVTTQSESDLKQTKEDNVEYQQLAVNGLSKGCILETLVAQRYDGGSIFGSVKLKSKSLVKEYNFYFFSPDWLKFKAKSYNCDKQCTDSIVEDRNVQFIKLENLATIEKEKYSFVNANVARVEYRFEKNLKNDYKANKYSDMGSAFFETLHTNGEKNLKAAAKYLKKIKLPETDKKETIFFIENHIKSGYIKNDGDKDDGLISSTIDSKIGTESEIARLFVYLLEAAGVQVDVILTCDKEEKRFDGEFHSWSFLNDLLLYCPDEKIFIEPTNLLTRSGRISESYLGQDGLFIKKVALGDALSAVCSVKNIPANTIETSNDEMEIALEFNGDLSEYSMQYMRKMNEYADQNLRAIYYHSDEDEKKELIESLVKGDNKNEKLSDISVSNYDISKYPEYKKPFEFTCKVVGSAFIENAGNKVIFKAGELIGEQVEMYEEKERKSNINIEFAHSYKRIIKIKIPEGYKVSGGEKFNMKLALPRDNKDVCLFESTYKEKDGFIIVECVEYYAELEYDKKYIKEFRSVINAASDFNKISLVFEKK